MPYAYRITLTVRLPMLGEVVQSFRTTTDALAGHLAALAHRPDVTMFAIEEL